MSPKPSPTTFAFGVPDQEVLTQELDKQHRTGLSDYDAFYFAVGLTQFRVLPPHQNCKIWFREVLKHRLVVGERANTKICPTMFDDPCPVCERARELYNYGDEASVEAAKALRPMRRYAVNAVIFAAPNGTEVDLGKCYILELPKTVKDELLEMDCDVPGGFADITGAFAASKGQGLLGVSFRVTKTGAGLNTRYSIRPIPMRTDLGQELAAIGADINDIELYDLSSIFKCGSYAELKSLLEASENSTPAAMPQQAVPVAAPTPAPVKSRVSVGKILPPPPAPDETEETLES